MELQYPLPIRSHVHGDSVMILDAIDRYLPTRNHQQSTRFRRNYVQPRMTACNDVLPAYVDGHHIFHVIDNINQITQVQSTTTNVQTNQRHLNLQRIRIEERIESEPCSVCLVEFSVGSNAIQLSCSHVYHQDCIMKWLDRSNTCPMCRRPVSDVPL